MIARHDLIIPAIGLVDGARLLARADREAVIDRARTAGLGRGVEVVATLVDACATGAGDPIIDEILDGPGPSRGRQLARKLWLCDGPLDALRLGANAVLASLARA
jgi:hypothetical protein